MSQRLNVCPILKDHCDAVFYVKLNNERHFMAQEATVLLGLPLLAGTAISALIGENEKFLDFTLKLSLLLMPLMLNLLFTLYRCMQDEGKTTADIEKKLKDDPPKDGTVISVFRSQAKKQRKTFEELCTHVLYTSLMCFGLAVLCGTLITADSIFSHFLSASFRASKPAWWTAFAFMSFVYAVMLHILATAVLILKKTYVLMGFNIARSGLKSEPTDAPAGPPS